jgi:hypothetical protein
MLPEFMFTKEAVAAMNAALCQPAERDVERKTNTEL